MTVMFAPNTASDELIRFQCVQQRIPNSECMVGRMMETDFGNGQKLSSENFHEMDLSFFFVANFCFGGWLLLLTLTSHTMWVKVKV